MTAPAKLQQNWNRYNESQHAAWAALWRRTESQTLGNSTADCGPAPAGKRCRWRGSSARMARLFWFTVEFGLVREGGEVKIYGSGLISTHADAANALGPDCERRPFSLEAA